MILYMPHTDGIYQTPTDKKNESDAGSNYDKEDESRADSNDDKEGESQVGSDDDSDKHHPQPA